MWKFLLLLPLLLFNGCWWDKEPTVCPQLRVLKAVEPIDINVTIIPGDTGGVFCIAGKSEDGRICGDSAMTIFKWMKKIRKSEVYYIEQIGIYNDSFIAQ